MSDCAKNEVRRYLNRFQLSQERIELKVDEVVHRLANLEAEQALILLRCEVLGISERARLPAETLF